MLKYIKNKFYSLLQKYFSCNTKILEINLPFDNTVKILIYKTNIILPNYDKFLNIKITPQEIEIFKNKRKGFYNPCPITEKLRIFFPSEYITVNGCGIHTNLKHKCSKNILDFIVNWDNFREITPINFQLKF